MLIGATVLALAGLVTMVSGYLIGSAGGLWLLLVGMTAVVTAIIPYLGAVERRERVEGLGVLAEEWLHSGGHPADSGLRHGLLDILQHLYRRNTGS